MRKEQFRFFVPVDTLTKAKDKKGNEVYKVGGIISDESTDADGENLDPSGFDYSEFNFINWNHGKSPSDIIGEPETWKHVPGKGVYMQGYIYPDSEKGKEAVDLMKTLQSSKKGNHLGWSVEGQVLERDIMNRNKVKRAKITAVALCPFPKNGNTFAELLRKGFTDGYQNDDELEYEGIEKGSENDIIDVVKENGERVRVTKDGEIEVEKAQSVENSSAVVKEDVEGNERAKEALLTVVKAHEQGIATDADLRKALKFRELL